MGQSIFIGLPARSQLKDTTTTVTYDRVAIQGWKMPPKK